MRYPNIYQIALLFLLPFFGCNNRTQKEELGLESIKASDLEHHLEFLASDEFKGRDTPSPELKIASRYLAQMAELYGLQPVMPDGSYFQHIPLETFTISEEETKIDLIEGSNVKTFRFQEDFGIGDRFLNPCDLEGELIFVGLGFQATDKSWDDLEEVDVLDKIAVILEPNLPESHLLRSPENRMPYRYRANKLMELGTKAVVRVIDGDRENKLATTGYGFENPVRSRVSGMIDEFEAQEPSGYKNIEIRHEMASAILGISKSALADICDQIQQGVQVPGFEIPGKRVAIKIALHQKSDSTRNVLALIEGSDPDLKNEYIIYVAHYDHIGAEEGEVYNGANDNGSGTVVLLELAEAIQSSDIGRSVLIAWLSGEEKGLWGSEYFVAYPPVPIEGINTCINLDVVSGNDLSKITVIGSQSLSSELDSMVQAISKDQIRVDLDYMTDNPRMANFFFTHSDQYPFIKYGIPSVWLGAESDPQEHIHQPSDITEFINYEKIELVTRFSYQLGIDLANHPTMIDLDVNPEITSRSEQNKGFDWEGFLSQ